MSSVAEERVKILLERAFETKRKDISTALRIAEAHNIILPEEYKFRVCGRCRSFLHPGRNAEVRLSKSAVKYRCGECGEVNSRGYE